MQRSAILLLAALIFASVPVRATEDSNSLIGVLTEVPTSSKFAGAQVTFTGLLSASPVMVWPDGHDERLSKLFENENLLVLQFVGGFGSTDTVHIEKKNKRFLVVSVGALSIVVPENTASVGVYRGYIK